MIVGYNGWYNREEVWKVHSDLGIQELNLGESWKKNAVINNPKSDTSCDLGLIDVTPYVLKSSVYLIVTYLTTRNDIVTPHVVGWYDNANGIFGIGLPGNRIGSVSLSESLRLSSFGLFFSEPYPRIDFNFFDGICIRLSS